MKKIIHLLLVVVTYSTTSVFAEIPAGYYYLAEGKNKSNLKTALNEIVSNGIFLNYGGEGVGYTWEGFYYTDRNPADSVVRDMYSNISRKQNNFSGVSGMHIEHSLPKSWWGGYVNNAYKDLNHLYPADGITNSTKNNLPLGIVQDPASLLDNGVSKVGKNNFDSTYTGNCFEPADEYKGDFARSYFYIATVYEEFAAMWQSPMMDNNTYPVWKAWALDLLLQWHRQDPVSDKELARVEAVYNIQGNRNPFIDYPDLVEYIWGNKTDEIFHFPVESRPFLITPNRWTCIDFGVVMQHSNQLIATTVKGLNLTSNLSLAIQHNSAGISLSKTSITPTEAINTTLISISFDAASIGTTQDTLLITGGGLINPLRIPITAIVSNEFMALPATNITSTSATLNWMTLPNITNYTLDVYQGTALASDLFFSAYTEGSTGYNKAVAIHNATGKTIDLSKYSLQKQNNGSGNFGTETSLSGTIVNGATCVIAHTGAGTEIANQTSLLLGSSVNDQSSVMAFNGNDAIALYHSGIQIDVIGEINEPTYWGQDITIRRKNNIAGPTTTFNWDEWINEGTDNFSNLNSHTVQLGQSNYIKQNLQLGNVNTYNIDQLQPEETYYYSIKASGATSTTSVNSIRFNTLPLETPLALDASIVYSDSFEAEWEEVPGATGYLLDVFSLSGEEFINSEGFDQVGSNGTPLPTGWNGTASGTYTTTASSGTSAPSIQLKNNGEYLQTPLFSAPIQTISFMGRFPSAATGSSLIVEGLNNTQWMRIDSIPYASTTSKFYPTYTFTCADNFSSIRFIYHKSAGNFAIDDITIKHGCVDTVYLFRDQEVTGNHYMARGTSATSDYYYRVRAMNGNKMSDFSNVIHVTTTDIPNAIKPLYTDALQIYTQASGIYVSGITTLTDIAIYHLSGICFYKTRTASNAIFIPCTQKGVFIIQIKAGQNNSIQKILK